MRTTLIGKCTPPNGCTPDAPARADDHLAVDLFTQDPVGRADVVAASGVIVAALMPSPLARIADAASWTTPLPVARRCSSDRSKRSRSRGSAARRVEDSQGLVEELLAGLVALQHGDAQGFRHAARVPWAAMDVCSCAASR